MLDFEGNYLLTRPPGDWRRTFPQILDAVARSDWSIVGNVISDSLAHLDRPAIARPDLLHLAVTLAQRGDYRDACSILQHLSTVGSYEDEVTVAALWCLAEIYLNETRYSNAIRALERVALLRTSHAQDWPPGLDNRLADTLQSAAAERSALVGEATAVLDRIIDKSDPPSEALLVSTERVITVLLQADEDRIIGARAAALEVAIRLFPNESARRLVRHLAGSFFRYGHYEQSHHWHLIWLASIHHPKDEVDHVLALNNLAVVEHRLGRIDEAIAHLAAALQLERQLGQTVLSPEASEDLAAWRRASQE